MTLAQLLVVLGGRRRSAVVAALSVLAAVALASALMWFIFPRYTASGALVLDVKSPDPIAGVTMAAGNLPSYMATQVDVLYSEKVALRVIDALKLDQDPELREDWMDSTDGRGDFRAWLAEIITRKLDARLGRESNVIAVKYTAKDAKRAADIANGFVDAYVAITLALRVEPARQYNAFFDERAKQLRDTVEEAQSKLSAYQRKHGILATDERVDAENQRLMELTTNLVQVQAVASESSNRQRQSGSTGSTPLPEVLNNTTVSQLTTERAKLDATLEQLRSRLGEAHPQVVELVARIGELNSLIATESKRVIGSVAAVSRINQSRLAEARSEVEQQRAKLLKLKAERDDLAVLMRDVDHAQKAYDLVVGRVAQTSIESQTTQTNVSVLKRATPPPFPSSPNLLLNGAGGILLALMFATITAMAREIRDQRLRVDDDIRLGLNLPLLGVLPHSRLVHRRDSLLRRRLTGALPAH